MIIFLLSFLLVGCYGADNLVAFKSENDVVPKNDVVYFLKNPTEDGTQFLSRKKIQAVDKYVIPTGKYSLACDNKLAIAKGYFDNFCVELVLEDKIICVKSDLHGDFETNLQLILNNKNFENNGQNSSVILDAQAKAVIDQEGIFQDLLTMCFYKKYVTISISDEVKFAEDDWEITAALFDEGVAPKVNDLLRNKARTKGISKVSIQSFIENIQKYDVSDFAWYEKILMRFDNKYIFTKGFFNDDAPYMTVRHSQTFRQNFLRYVGIPFAMMMIMVKTYGACTGK